MLDNQEFVCSSLNVSVNPNKRRTADGRDVSPDVYNRKGGIGANTDYEPQVTCSTTGLEVIWPKTTNGYRYYLTVSAKPTNRGHLMTTACTPTATPAPSPRPMSATTPSPPMSTVAAARHTSICR